MERIKSLKKYITWQNYFGLVLVYEAILVLSMQTMESYLHYIPLVLFFFICDYRKNINAILPFLKRNWYAFLSLILLIRHFGYSFTSPILIVLFSYLFAGYMVGIEKERPFHFSKPLIVILTFVFAVSDLCHLIQYNPLLGHFGAAQVFSQFTTTRLSAIFGHPIPAACICVLYCFLCLLYIDNVKLRIGLTVFGFFSLFITGSRGCLLAFLGVLFIYYLIHFMKEKPDVKQFINRKNVLILCSGIFVLLCIPDTRNQVMTVFTRVASLKNEINGDYYRIVAWKLMVLYVWPSNSLGTMLFGQGYQSCLSAMLNTQNEKILSAFEWGKGAGLQPGTVDNMFLSTLYDYGLVGLVLLLGIILCCACLIYKGNKDQKNISITLITLMLCCVTFDAQYWSTISFVVIFLYGYLTASSNSIFYTLSNSIFSEKVERLKIYKEKFLKQCSKIVTYLDNDKVKVQTDIIVLCFVAVYLIKILISSTKVSIVYPENLFLFILWGLRFFACFNVLKSLLKKEYLQSLILITILLIGYISNQIVGYEFILWLSLIIVAVKDINYNHILSVYLCVSVVLIVLTIALSQIGSIDNLVYSSGERIRSSWGIGYPTDFASYFVFVAAFMWIKMRKVHEGFSLIPAFISLYIAWVIAESKTSVLCSLMLIILICFDMFLPYLKQKIKVFKFLWKTFIILLKYSFFIFALFTSISAVLVYLKLPIANTIDSIMNHRLFLMCDAFKEHGIHAFGTYFSMIGNGGSTFSLLETYNFIDNSYALMLIRYGYVFFIFAYYAWMKTMNKTIEVQDYRLAMVMALIAFHSLSEHHFTELNYNVLFVLPFAKFETPKYENTKEGDIATGIVIVSVSLLFMAILPSVLMQLRTYVDIHTFGEGMYSANFMMLIIVIIGLLLMIVYYYAVYYSLRKKKECAYFWTFVTVICFGFVYSYYGLALKVNYTYKKYSSILQEEKAVMDIINDSKSGNLYSSVIPAYYNKCYGGITTGLREDEELAQHDDITVIVDSDFDSQILINHNFCWLQISDTHAIYTNDSNVIRGLEESGYTLSSYYSKDKSVDLAWEANFNGIAYIDNSIVLNDANKLLMGPYINLHTGTYHLNFKLNGLITDYDGVNDKEVCKISITAYSGELPIVEKTVLYSEFNEFGEYVGTIDFDSLNYMNIEFKFEALNGSQVNLNEMSYGRVGE